MGLVLLAHFRRLFPLFFKWMHADDDETVLLVTAICTNFLEYLGKHIVFSVDLNDVLLSEFSPEHWLSDRTYLIVGLVHIRRF